jgi:hypothetical protein
MEKRSLNAEKSFILASTLFPGEEWVLKEPNIWVAKSRLPEEYREKDKWEREMSQVRILTGRGSVAYFLPEKKHSVYIRLLSDISLGSVKAKIAGELKHRPGTGHFICYFGYALLLVV